MGATTGNNGVYGGSEETGSTAITTAQMPNHSHSYQNARSAGGKAAQGDYLTGVWYDGGTAAQSSTSSTGSGAGHSHTIDPLHVKLIYIIFLGPR